jgi:hypothetical protein
LQVLAHEIEFVLAMVIGRVEGGFCRREREDQPAVAGVYGVEAEDVAKKCAVCIGVLAVDDYVGAGNHGSLLPKSGNALFPRLILRNIGPRRSNRREIPRRHGNGIRASLGMTASTAIQEHPWTTW